MRPYRRMPLMMAGVVVLLVAVAPAAVAFAAINPTPVIPSYPRPAEPTPQQRQQQQQEAQQASAAPAPTPKVTVPSGTQPYNMDFTLPTLGKAGCMVCHGDPNLIRIRGDQYVSFYIDDAQMRASAHGNVACTGCHLDFAYKAPHKSANDWHKTSKQACKNCHQRQYDAYSLGAHAVENKPGTVDPKADAKPLCGDCHGAHDIKKLGNDPQAQAELHRDGYRVCGRCHQKEWDSYADYYHGAAYRRGAEDAPACWDCHDQHTILPSSDPRSPTNEQNIVDTCGGSVAGRTCHKGASSTFVTYAGLIHRGSQTLEANPLYSFIHDTQEGISAALSNIVGAVRSWFT